MTYSKHFNIVHVKSLALTGHGLAVRVLFPSLQCALEAKRQNIILKFRINCAIVAVQQSQSYHKWFKSRLQLLVKGEKRYCGIKQVLTKVITLIFITRHVSILADYLYKESIEFGANLAFSI